MGEGEVRGREKRFRKHIGKEIEKDVGRLYASASRSASLLHLGSESGGRFNRAVCLCGTSQRL